MFMWNCGKQLSIIAKQFSIGENTKPKPLHVNLKIINKKTIGK